MKTSNQTLCLVRAQGGFTMIELIMVIVILGILAAVAVPKFTNLSSNARTSAIQGIAGGISSANSTNVAVCGVSSTNTNCVTVTNCSNGGSLLQGGLPSGYTITSSAVASGVTNSACVLTDSASTGVTANFTITGAP